MTEFRHLTKIRHKPCCSLSFYGLILAPIFAPPFKETYWLKGGPMNYLKMQKNKVQKNKSKNNIFESLRKQLKCFGLNPNNWNLIPSSAHSQFIIINKKNKNFRLIGTPLFKGKKKPTWKDIQLLSL